MDACLQFYSILKIYPVTSVPLDATSLTVQCGLRYISALLHHPARATVTLTIVAGPSEYSHRRRCPLLCLFALPLLPLALLLLLALLALELLRRRAGLCKRATVIAFSTRDQPSGLPRSPLAPLVLRSLPPEEEDPEAVAFSFSPDPVGAISRCMPDARVGANDDDETCDD